MDAERLIYPYFSTDLVLLQKHAASLGLWLRAAAVPADLQMRVESWMCERTNLFIGSNTATR